ncbi:MAG: type II toxin-antitoxin system RelE/ParE family toxin [Cyanobacteria bacterium P01_E01_bin.6]
MKSALKPVLWVGSALKDLKAFPEEVRSEVGFALFQAQRGEKPLNTKPLKGYSGASVLEIRENFDKDTYRVVYTVQFAKAVYVLHAFQKKSKTGIATPKKDLATIDSRLKDAQQHYAANYQEK